MHPSEIPLPENWPHLVRKAILHVSSLAHHTMIYTRSMAANSPISRVRLCAKVDRLTEAVALSKEIMAIKDARIERIPPLRRPRYTSTERMRILELRAAHGWNARDTARHFQITEETIASWMTGLDEEGKDHLVEVAEPINKYPEWVTYATQRIKAMCPRLGKRMIVMIYFRLGIYLSSTTIGRRLKAETERPEDPSSDAAPVADEEPPRVVTAKHPNHVWHTDLTPVRTTGGFWSSWAGVLPQCWPFCWQVLVIMDHFSRKCIGFAVFCGQPTAQDIIAALNSAIHRNGKPKYIISDKGCHFWSPKATCLSESKDHAYHKWCKKNGIKPRFGAVHKHGSIAVVERFIKSLKDEYTREIVVPFSMTDMRYEVGTYIEWYNQHRPHRYLEGRTPEQVYARAPPPPVMRVLPNSALPEAIIEIAFFEGRKQLPVFSIKKAA